MESLFCIWFGWCWNSIKWVILHYFEMTREVLRPSQETGDGYEVVAKTKGSVIPEVLSDITRRSLQNIYEWVWIVEGLLPSLKLLAFLPGLWEDWQVYLPLSSQSSSLLNVCRPVGFRFGLQQKSFVMMKSQSFLSVFHFEGPEGLCGVVERDLLCSYGFDEYVLLQW